MKLFSALLASSVLAAALATGCAESPTASNKALEPAIELSSPTAMQTGESRRIIAATQNLVGAHELRWTVTPSGGGQVRSEQQNAGQSAIFSAQQPGVYVITASADAGNGRMISNSTTVTVNGQPMTSERQPEQPPR